MYSDTIEEVSTIKIPTKNYGILNAKGFLYEGEAAIVLYNGSIVKARNPIVRIHSQCLSSEVFHSLRCDCSTQLNEAMRLISKQPPGLIIYLFQEGRGAGLVNKFRANKLEDEGMDTVEAYSALHLPLDQRDYKIAAEIIKYFSIKKIRLLTNNPHKIENLKKYGVTISKRLPLEIEPNEYNRDYLKTKKKKMGHLLNNI